MKSPTILCVDDAQPFLEFYQTLLGRHGYMVIAANNGLQALAAFHANVTDIDAVIVDYEMPGMTGVELAKLLKTHDPALPVLLISAYHPELCDPSPFIDLAIAKGSSIREITGALRLLVAARASRQSENRPRQFVAGLEWNPAS